MKISIPYSPRYFAVAWETRKVDVLKAAPFTIGAKTYTLAVHRVIDNPHFVTAVEWESGKNFVGADYDTPEKAISGMKKHMASIVSMHGERVAQNLIEVAQMDNGLNKPYFNDEDEL